MITNKSSGNIHNHNDWLITTIPNTDVHSDQKSNI